MTMGLSKFGETLAKSVHYFESLKGIIHMLTVVFVSVVAPVVKGELATLD